MFTTSMKPVGERLSKINMQNICEYIPNGGVQKDFVAHPSWKIFGIKN